MVIWPEGLLLEAKPYWVVCLKFLTWRSLVGRSWHWCAFACPEHKVQQNNIFHKVVYIWKDAKDSKKPHMFSTPYCDYSTICFSGPLKYSSGPHFTSTRRYLLSTHCKAGTIYVFNEEACAKCEDWFMCWKAIFWGWSRVGTLPPGGMAARSDWVPLTTYSWDTMLPSPLLIVSKTRVYFSPSQASEGRLNGT